MALDIDPAVRDRILAGLNPPQRAAVCHGRAPLLIVAGAGTGKTTTLAHRVAFLIASGADPSRVLLLTFTRRAAAEMLRRTEALLQHDGHRIWGGTFHAVASRLLRLHGASIGLHPDFGILDRSDAEDLLAVLRAELGLARLDRRFPAKGTCLDIYSRCVNAALRLEDLVPRAFPWCSDDVAGLAQLFTAYTERKADQRVLDYDDLLLYWRGLMTDPAACAHVRRRFDCVLVDEYQDTNALQADILRRLCPQGEGLTVVGDDAQSIYSFRAATVRNILDFGAHFPAATRVTLDENYRSTAPILQATNRVIAQANERIPKDLRARRAAGGRPQLVTCADEDEQSEHIVHQVLEHRESGIALRRQAVLFRASHHSLALELELGRRNIPFHKYGGLKFVEAAHVKDLLAFLRLADNPRDLVAGLRVLLLLPGIGPKRARALLDDPWPTTPPSPACAALWPDFLALMRALKAQQPVATQVHAVRTFYAPLLERLHDAAPARLRDLEQLEAIAARYPDRRAFLEELALDPPSSTQDLAGPPHKDDDYLILSTIHSAKGLEWDVVFVIHAADGNIPSDMSTGTPEEVDEELRLFYVALTRARDWLYVCWPQRYFSRPGSDRHTYAQLSRFLPEQVRHEFHTCDAARAPESAPAIEPAPAPAVDAAAIRRQIRDLWS